MGHWRPYPLLKFNLAVPFLVALLVASLSPVYAGHITVPTLPSMGNFGGVCLNTDGSGNAVFAGGSATTSEFDFSDPLLADQSLFTDAALPMS